MKKVKKISTDKAKIGLFKPETKCSRLTVDSRICNIDKFNELFQILDYTKDFKNTVSSYCFTNLTKLVTNYSEFLTNYNLFKSKHLNSWEKQTIFAEIAGHYFETATRYLSKAKYIVQKQSFLSKSNEITKVKNKLSSIAELIDLNSNLVCFQNYVLINYQQVYAIDFDIKSKLTSLNNYLVKYNKDLEQNKELIKKKSNDDLTKEIIRLEKLIVSYNKIIKIYEEVQQFSLTKSDIYNRIINLVTTKKLRLLKKVKLSVYQTGTHARNLDNAQLSIVKDTTNSKYQYFLKFRKHNKLDGREPKLKETRSNKIIITKEFVEELKVEQKLKDTLDYENKINYQLKLAKYNEDNFIYLPLIFNHEKLKQIGRKLDTILTKNNPQILLKSEQLRIGSKSRKIHLIFNYEEQSKLGEIIENNQYIAPDEENTIGFDVNLKHNLLADSNGQFYDEILKPVNKDINVNKSKFIDNLNEIVVLQSIETSLRTEKQKYRYEKLLRCNESLLKTYLLGLIKDWKSQDITHLVMEDLNLIRDKSYYEHQNVKIKYSRLARLLRLSQIKLWVSQMAEKQGLFTHWVNPAYTSQECSKCHFISPLNRLNQEIFKCTNKNCNMEMNADINSALNIKNRLLHKELRAKLNKDNVYLCSRPKPIYYRNIKTIIKDVFKDSYNYEVYKSGVITELFPENMISRIQSKKEEASPFRAG